MHKREFLRSLGLCALGLYVPRQGSGEPGGRPTKNWVWITVERERSPDDWAREFERMRAAGIDAVLPEVYDGRHAYWASTRLPVKSERLETLLPLARAEGLEVHAWMWCMPCLVESVLKQHPDWYNVNARGESAADKPAYVDYYRFLDPARPEVREFVRANLEELAGFAELTGVHLDYIRHPDAILPKGLWSKYGLVQDRVYPQFDYGYTPYSRKQFERQNGVDPVDIEDEAMRERWRRYRLDSVSDLVNDYLVPAAHARGKQISAAVFPGPTLARSMVYQDWGRWKLDAFLPMLYHNFYQAGAKWVEEQTREGVATVAAPVYSGLFVPALDADGLRGAVDAALAGGAAGVSLFSADALDEPRWRALAAAVGRA